MAKKRRRPKIKSTKGFKLTKKEQEKIERIKTKYGDDGSFELVGYEITSDPIEDKEFKRLPSQVKNRIKELHDMALSTPKEAVTEIKALIKKYPNIPMLYNYLNAAYTKLGNIEEREAIVMECYQKFPDYLFGRLNYAQLCMQRGEIEKIPEIFDDKFDLTLLYPHRKRFHISEFVNFSGVIGVYYAATGELDIAKMHYKAIKKIAPWDGATGMLKKAIYPSLKIRFVRWLYKKLTGQEFTQIRR